jgi:hypothetical protein
VMTFASFPQRCAGMKRSPDYRVCCDDTQSEASPHSPVIQYIMVMSRKGPYPMGVSMMKRAAR